MNIVFDELISEAIILSMPPNPVWLSTRLITSDSQPNNGVARFGKLKESVTTEGGPGKLLLTTPLSVGENAPLALSYQLYEHCFYLICNTFEIVLLQ